MFKILEIKKNKYENIKIVSKNIFKFQKENLKKKLGKKFRNFFIKEFKFENILFKTIKKVFYFLIYLFVFIYERKSATLSISSPFVVRLVSRS